MFKRATPILLVFCMLGCFCASASADASGPKWMVTAVGVPTNFAPGGESAYRITVKNTGGGTTDGSIVSVTDELPAGISLAPAGASGTDQLSGAHVNCGSRTCTFTGAMSPDDALTITVPVKVDPSLEPGSTVRNVVRAAGGGAATAAVVSETVISSSPADFGIASGGAATMLSDEQAGAHSDLTTSIAFDTVDSLGGLAGAPKDTVDDLPPGFAGDLVDTPSCSANRFSLGECPVGSQVGVVTLTVTLAHKPAFISTRPVYNLDPNPGEVAKIGFFALSVLQVQGEVSVRPGDYGLETVFHNTDEQPAELDSVSLTIWGVPASPSHDSWRWVNEGQGIGHFGASSDSRLAPFLTNPTACADASLEARFTATSWSTSTPSEKAMGFGPLSGCDRLEMAPSVSIAPTTPHAYAATGLNFALDIPQTNEDSQGLATPTLDSAVVTLPEGMTVNPSAGAGLAACTQAEFENEQIQAVAGGGCPSTARVGSVTIQTPALKEEARGAVYIAEPYSNQFGSLLALYVVARIPERGVLVKAAGEVLADPLTGQLVTRFSGLPPLPFDRLLFSFREGAIAPLVTPPTCGSYDAEAQLVTLASPQVLSPLVPSFEISSGFDGGACPAGGEAPFAPRMSAGTIDNRAGSYSPLDLLISRNDGEQEITGFAQQFPLGLTANLTGVPFCSEAAIALARTKTGAQEEAEPSCPPASQIGHLLASAGVGSVLVQAPGKIYMAGPYEGAPFSAVAITSAKVGPFDLGTVVVHLPLQINPVTATVSIPAGAADQIPHIIKGIVIHLREIHVYIDKQSFTLNPTSCARQTFSATVIGGGANPTNPADSDPITIANPFQAADCANLKFAPKFAVSTSGKTSKAQGASLHVKLTYPQGPVGTYANIARVKVDLPKQLPSQLKTLQKACTAKQFEANPAGCPAASIVGHAKAVTPLIPVPLEGPAIFVSHGNEAFPSLIMVLQGYGITIDLVGSTFISKAGVTSSTFKAVPDQPIGSFELTLPQGKYSALAANGNLCKSKLAMPTEFLAQNGAKINESTKISVTGCPKVKKARKKHSAAKAKKRGKK
jgi:uncharacterized repeat protein (TIGR01451 family)